jgi:hypothetical protein
VNEVEVWKVKSVTLHCSHPEDLLLQSCISHPIYLEYPGKDPKSRWLLEFEGVIRFIRVKVKICRIHLLRISSFKFFFFLDISSSLRSCFCNSSLSHHNHFSLSLSLSLSLGFTHIFSLRCFLFSLASFGYPEYRQFLGRILHLSGLPVLGQDPEAGR